jgi:signal peptidase I
MYASGLVNRHRQAKEGIVENKPRRPWLAALLTLFEIGLGHIYSGNFRKGLILFCMDQFLSFVFIASLTLVAPNTFYVVFALSAGFAFIIYCVVDAAVIAKRNNKNYVPAKYNRWFVYVGYFLLQGFSFKCVRLSSWPHI